MKKFLLIHLIIFAMTAQSQAYSDHIGFELGSIAVRINTEQFQF